MKIKYTILLLFSLVIFVSCTDKHHTTNDIKTLSVTNSPQKFFLEQLVENKYKINVLIPPGVNPESMDATPSQIMALSNSELYFKVGYLDIENILVDKAIENNKNIKIINCSEGIDIIKEEDYHIEAGHGGHSAGDPHVWSSVENAKIIAQNMFNVLSKNDSINISCFENNYRQLLANLNRTDSTIKSILSVRQTNSFVIYHPALSYFSRDYGLNQLTIEKDGKNPSPSQLKNLIDLARDENVKVVFIQKEFDSKNAETIAKSIGAETVSIDLLSNEWDLELIKMAKAIAGKYE